MLGFRKNKTTKNREQQIPNISEINGRNLAKKLCKTKPHQGGVKTNNHENSINTKTQIITLTFSKKNFRYKDIEIIFTFANKKNKKI
jgi:hypothetical protein